MKKKLGVAAVAVAIGVAILSTLSPSASYYVDCIGGSDTNTGTSVDEAWETLARVHTMDFAPGDVVHFNRGCTWTGKLVVDDSGEEGSPIVFTAYGTGDRPVFSNPGDPDNWTRAVDIVADWVIVEGLLVRDAHRTGVRIEGDHDIVRDVEVTDTGSGVSVRGSHNLITQNYIHDLSMVKNTPGGNDDFGAEGIKFYAPYNEASHNRMENCAAPSYDYGVDGGGFVLLSNSDGTYIHHNWVEGSAGFLEVGMGSARDVVVAYNVSVNNEIFSWLHLTGTFGAEVENFRVENNTIVETGDISRPFGFAGEVDYDTFSLHNNIVYAPQTYIVSNRSNFAHQYNLYFIGDATFHWDPTVEFDPTEIIADPLFVDLAGKDFRLQHNSPAIDVGVGLGHTEDFEGNLVPIGVALDVGALEYQTSQLTPTPWYNVCPTAPVCATYTPCPVPTCRPVPTCPSLPTSTPWPPQPYTVTATPAPPTGQIYYVATSGDNSNPGTKTQPFATIQKAVDVAGPGDQIHVRSGTYIQERVVFRNSGLPGAPIVLRNAPGESPTFEGGMRLIGVSYIHVVGFDITGSTTQWITVYIRQGHHILVEDNHIHDTEGSAKHAIRIEDASYNTLRNNTISNCLNGIEVGSEGVAPTEYNIIENNHIFGNDRYGGNSDGIHLSGALTRFNVIRYNIVHDNADDGIDTWTSAHNLIYANIAYHNGYMRDGSVGFDGNGFKLGSGRGQSGGNLVVNNIAYDNRVMGFVTNSGPLPNSVYNNTAYNNLHGFREWAGSGGSTFRNNIGYANEAADFNFGADTHADHNLSINPLFVDIANADFHLQIGSPAINIGLSLSQDDLPDAFLAAEDTFRQEALNQLNSDFDRVSRPQGVGWDAGAYEFSE